MNFIAIDFETANYSRESACSVGLVKYENGKQADTFYSLVRPPVLYIRPDFTEIHGLTVEDVRHAPTFDVIWKESMESFIGDLPLAAHNASFDMNVLRAVLGWYELPVPTLSYFCTLNIARKVWPGLNSHRLTYLGKQFGIEYNAHNALDDAMTCGKLVLLAAEKYGTGTLEEMFTALRMQRKIL